MLTTRYVHTNSGGRVLDRSQWLSWVGSRRERVLSGALRYNDYRTLELQFRIYGEAAVVTGRNVARGVDGDVRASV